MFDRPARAMVRFAEHVNGHAGHQVTCSRTLSSGLATRSCFVECMGRGRRLDPRATHRGSHDGVDVACFPRVGPGSAGAGSGNLNVLPLEYSQVPRRARGTEVKPSPVLWYCDSKKANSESFLQVVM